MDGEKATGTSKGMHCLRQSPLGQLVGEARRLVHLPSSFKLYFRSKRLIYVAVLLIILAKVTFAFVVDLSNTTHHHSDVLHVSIGSPFGSPHLGTPSSIYR